MKMQQNLTHSNPAVAKNAQRKHVSSVGLKKFLAAHGMMAGSTELRTSNTVSLCCSADLPFMMTSLISTKPSYPFFLGFMPEHTRHRGK